MTFNYSTHRTILFQILKDIYSDTNIAPYLGFKGGTAAAFFYQLDRFSVDLDFDLLDESHLDLVYDTIYSIINKYGIVKDQEKKRFSLFFLLSYEDKFHNVKVEINRRQFGSQYKLQTLLGIPMLVMERQDMFAHKIMAMHERIGQTSRDIYDIWFFLQHRFPINQTIIEQRAGLPFAEVIQACIDQLNKLNTNKILDGVGELLTDSQKDWAKAKLKQETIALLRLRLPA